MVLPELSTPRVVRLSIAALPPTSPVSKLRSQRARSSTVVKRLVAPSLEKESTLLRQPPPSRGA